MAVCAKLESVREMGIVMLLLVLLIGFPGFRDGSAISPNSDPSPKRHHHHHPHHLRHHHHHHSRHHAVSPTPATMPGCDNETCAKPLTPTPINSPCGCVLPIQVQLFFIVASYAVFPLVGELEVEVAAGLYLQQSQVRIEAIAADVQDQGTTVDIELVPLGEKFDHTTALLIYDRFWGKKVSVDEKYFGNYDVIYVRYPGLPFSPPFEGSPRAASGSQEKPIAAIVNKSNKMNARTIAIIVLCAVVLLASVGVVSVLLKCKIYRRSTMPVDPAFTSSITKRSNSESITSTGLENSSPLSLVSVIAAFKFSVKRFSLAEIEKATGKFSSKKILGEGGFGCVYHGILDNGAEIAVKLLTRENRSGDSEFIAEIEMLSRLHHRNLVKLIGICVEKHRRCLVYEVVHNGSVESHLHGADKRKGFLDWDARMKIALGAARGLAYLHEDSTPRVIHRDFKASNVLLEVDFTPKVSDFGLAREATEGCNYITTRVMGTFGYVAPEYAMTGHLLVKSDVYSYGVVLLELLTGRKPVDMSQPRGQENLVTWARPLLTTREGLEQLVDPALNGNYDFKDIARFASIASMCVHPEVSERPFMGEVVQALKIIYNDTDVEYGVYSSQKGSPSLHDSDYKGDICTSDSWETDEATQHLTHGFASSYITMEYNSSPLEDIDDDRLLSLYHLIEKDEQLPSKHTSRSGPLRTKKKPVLIRRGSESEPARLSVRSCDNGLYV